MRSRPKPGIFPASLPDQLTHILMSMNVDMEGNPADPFIDDDWGLQACRFVNGDPSRLEVIFTGILGGRVRLTLSAKKLGQGWFEPGVLGDEGDPAPHPDCQVSEYARKRDSRTQPAGCLPRHRPHQDEAVEDLRRINGGGEVSRKSRVYARFGTN